MLKNLIFNPEGNDSIDSRQIMGGSTTNIMNLNNVRFKWATQLYRQMRENFWLAEKVDLTNDVKDYRNLSAEERRAFDGILSYLTYLDSLQTHNLPHIGEFITAPEVTLCLTEQASQEALHSQSYQYIIESLVPSDRRNLIYDQWRTDPVLYNRTSLVAEAYQRFWDNPTDETYFEALCSNFILEGLFFYNGFVFFYNLAAHGKMSGVSDIIRYIQRDEMTHVRLFQKILPEAAEVLNQNLQKILTTLMQKAVEEEIAWSTHILKNVPGVTEESTRQYTQHLADLRLRSLGFPVLYNAPNPYKAFDRIGDASSDGHVRSNFFEANVTSYNQSTAVEGWAEISAMGFRH